MKGRLFENNEELWWFGSQHATFYVYEWNMDSSTIYSYQCWHNSKTDGVMKNNCSSWWIIAHSGSEMGFVSGAPYF